MTFIFIEKPIQILQVKIEIHCPFPTHLVNMTEIKLNIFV